MGGPSLWRRRGSPLGQIAAADVLSAYNHYVLESESCPISTRTSIRQSHSHAWHVLGLLHTGVGKDCSLFQKRSPVTQGGLSHCPHGQGRWKRHSTRWSSHKNRRLSLSFCRQSRRRAPDRGHGACPWSVRERTNKARTAFLGCPLARVGGGCIEEHS